MWYDEKRLSNWHFITYIQWTADRSNLWFFIHFYYSQMIRAFSRSFYCFLIYMFKLFLTIMMSRLQKLFIQSHSEIIQSTQSKCCEPKITSYEHGTFLQNRSSHSIWMFLYRMYFIRETFLRYKTNILCLAFNHAKESVSSKKMQLGYSTKLSAKYSETWNKNLVQKN